MSLMNPTLTSPAAVAAEPSRAAVPSSTWALTSLALAALLSALGTSIANVALPTLATAFGASFGAMQWVVLAYLLASTSLVVGVGRLGDMMGRRWLLRAGLVVFTAGSALCGLAPNLGALIAARALQGLGAAVMMALTVALVSGTVPAGRTGRVIGLLGTMSALGTALGPSLGGVLIAGFGWRAIFLVNVPLGAAVWWLTGRHVPADGPRRAARTTEFDTFGTVLLAGALAAYALSLTLGRGTFGSLNAALLVAAGAGLAAFVVTETSVDAPLVDLATLRDPALRTGLVLSGLVATVMMATLVVGPFFLARSLGLVPAAVGLVMSAGPLVAAVNAAPAGRLVDRLGAGRMTTLGLGIMTAACAVLVAAPARWGVAGYVGPMVVLTAGYALFQTANNTAIMAGAGAERRGVVSGLLNLARNLGLITGTAVMGAIFAHATGDLATATPAAVAEGLRITFGVAGGLVAVGWVVAIGGKR